MTYKILHDLCPENLRHKFTERSMISEYRNRNREHLCNNGLLTPHQSGFRPGDSTINQLLAITHKIYTAFEEIPSRETLLVFLDLSKSPAEKHFSSSSIFRRLLIESGTMAYYTNWNAMESLGIFCHYLVTFYKIVGSGLY